MGIIKEDFMLNNETGKKLYNDFAKNLPIIDYHCHLPANILANEYNFKDAFDLFLNHDHYKWRQMRNFGIEEEYVTGKKDGYESWLAFARLTPYLIGNPLYHWTHLELKRYFDIDMPLCEENAKEIWDIIEEKLKQREYSARSLVLKSNVEVICTTDDPQDDLRYHKKLKEEGFKVKVLPTFRPDKAVNIEREWFLPYIKENNIKSYAQLVSWLKEKIAYFNENGCKLADHDVNIVSYAFGNPDEIFQKKVNGIKLTKEEEEIYRTSLILECAKEYKKYDWVMQIHIGAMRNNNKRMFESYGVDAGLDTMNDLCIAEKLSALLNNLDETDSLPKTILYGLNPKDNYVLGTMIGNFQKAPVKGKLQFGSGWWYNDNKKGMEEQMSALANLGILGTFVGMLTDSRSFVSYTRHEYFRRILCNMLGKWVEDGEYPYDLKYLKKIVEGICYYNAKEYFNF